MDQQEAFKYEKFFRRSAVTEIILTIIWYFVANFDAEKDAQVQSIVAWTITASLLTMACLHLALLRIHMCNKLYLTYIAFLFTILTTGLLIFHVILAAHSLSTSVKILKYAVFLFIIAFWIIKAKRHARFIFEFRRAKYEEDLALYQALSESGEEDDETQYQRHSTTIVVDNDASRLQVPIITRIAS